MVVFDELPVTSLLRADARIDARRYPNFAALARDSTWFRNTAAVDGATQVAVPAILTGRRPRPDELPTSEDHPQNLFTLLGGDRRMHVSESITSLCPESLCARTRPGFAQRMRSLASDLRIVTAHVLLPDDLRRRMPSIDARWQDFGGGDGDGGDGAGAGGHVRQAFAERVDDRPEEFERFVAAHPRTARSSKGSLSFLHVLLPHVPWQYLPDGKRYGAGNEILGLADERWTDEPGAAEVGYQRHLLQVGFVDRLLGALLRRLKADGTHDDSLVVVTADHGVSFHAGGSRRDVTRETAVDLLPVPFFVKAPGQTRGRVVQTQLQTVDVLPTLASILGIRLPWRADGRSGFAANAGRQTVHATSGGRRPLEMSGPALRLLQVVALRRQVALLGAGGPPELRAVGGDLVGTRVPAGIPSAADASAEVQDPGRFASVDPGAGFLPVHVTRVVHGSDAQRVAVAVNGRIGAVVPVSASNGARAFSGMVPESLLREGANRIEVLAVEGKGPARRLRSLARIGRGTGVYVLEDGSIRAGDGTRYRIVGGALKGVVDRSLVDGDVVRLAGWEIDPRARRPVEQIVVFGDDGLLFSGQPTGARTDIAAANDARPERLAFEFDVPDEGFRGRPAVYALRDGVASPLGWFCRGGTQDIGC